MVGTFLLFSSVFAVAGALGAAAPDFVPVPACEDWACVQRVAGVRESRERDFLGRNVVVYRSVGMEVRVYLGYAGEIDEIWAYDPKSRKPVSLDRFGAVKRVHEEYRAGSLASRSEWWQLPIKDGPIYMETEYFPESGKPWKKITWIKAKGRGVATAGGVAACVEGVTPLAVAAGDIPSIVGELFGKGPTSASRIHFRTEGCGGAGWKARRSLVQESLSEGLQCMMDPARGGGGSPSRGQRDAGVLMAMMANSSQPYTIRCMPAGMPNGDLGAATLCPSFVSQLGAVNEGLPPFPGIALATNVAVTEDYEKRDFKRTFFHEALHTVGYPHGHFPEVCHACEKCCFPRAGNDVSDACALCRTPNDPAALTPDYIVKYVKELGAMAPPTALISFSHLALRAGTPNVMAQYADAILTRLCPSRSFDGTSGCPASAIQAYAYFAGIQARLRAAGSPLATSAVDAAVLARATAALDPVERSATNFSVVMTAAHVGGRDAVASLREAMTFFRTSECPRLSRPVDPEDFVRRGLHRGIIDMLDVFQEFPDGTVSRTYLSAASSIPQASDGIVDLERICRGG